MKASALMIFLFVSTLRINIIHLKNTCKNMILSLKPVLLRAPANLSLSPSKRMGLTKMNLVESLLFLKIRTMLLITINLKIKIWGMKFFALFVGELIIWPRIVFNAIANLRLSLNLRLMLSPPVLPLIPHLTGTMSLALS